MYDDGQVAPSDTAERATKVVGGSTVEAADLIVGPPDALDQYLDTVHT